MAVKAVSKDKSSSSKSNSKEWKCDRPGCTRSFPKESSLRKHQTGTHKDTPAAFALALRWVFRNMAIFEIGIDV